MIIRLTVIKVLTAVTRLPLMHMKEPVAGVLVVMSGKEILLVK